VVLVRTGLVKTGFAKVEGGVLVGFRVRGLCSAVVSYMAMVIRMVL
jgi:hypothetical protein